VRRGSVRVRFGTIRVWRGSIRVGLGSIRERQGSIIVRRGSNGSLSACCAAGPSLIHGSAPHGGFLAEQRSDEDTRRQPRQMMKDERMYGCIV